MPPTAGDERHRQGHTLPLFVYTLVLDQPFSLSKLIPSNQCRRRELCIACIFICTAISYLVFYMLWLAAPLSSWSESDTFVAIYDELQLIFLYFLEFSHIDAHVYLDKPLEGYSVELDILADPLHHVNISLIEKNIRFSLHLLLMACARTCDG